MQQPEVVGYVKKVYKHVDLIFGTHNLYMVPELLYTAIQEKHPVIEVWESTGQIAEDMPIERKDGVKAWVTVMYGCNNFCSYCIVPYVRGRERSREIEDVVKEVTFLANEGYKEVTLLGQNVNSYGKDLGEGTTFAKLLYAIDKIEGIDRIRFATSHPKDLSDELIIAMKDCKKVCEHLHLPVQAGSSKVLHEMNRKYTKEDYLALVDRVRKEIPEISLTTDIIVGFPGETEEDFEDTLDVMRKVKFDSAYTFLYSKRTGTPAAKRLEQVPEAVMKDRFQRLLDVQNEISKELNDKLYGEIVEVLVEGPSKTNEEFMTGRTRTNKVVNFKGGQDLKGMLVKVKIDKTLTWSLDGKIVE
jgi:tRNA-2-methylthio-N6-dimethylallyladenosine synthase